MKSNRSIPRILLLLLARARARVSVCQGDDQRSEAVLNFAAFPAASDPDKRGPPIDVREVAASSDRDAKKEMETAKYVRFQKSEVHLQQPPAN